MLFTCINSKSFLKKVFQTLKELLVKLLKYMRIVIELAIHNRFMRAKMLKSSNRLIYLIKNKILNIKIIFKIYLKILKTFYLFK